MLARHRKHWPRGRTAERGRRLHQEAGGQRRGRFAFGRGCSFGRGRRCGGVAGGAAGRVLDAIGLEAAEAAVLPVLARLVGVQIRAIACGQGQGWGRCRCRCQCQCQPQSHSQSLGLRVSTHVAALAAVRVEGIVETVVVQLTGHITPLRGLPSADVWAELILARVEASEALAA